MYGIWNNYDIGKHNNIEDTQSKKERQGELLLPQNHNNLSFKLFSLNI
jgi:hypothetical protein